MIGRPAIGTTQPAGRWNGLDRSVASSTRLLYSVSAHDGRCVAGAAAVALSYLLAVALVFAAWLLTGQILERHAFRHALPLAGQHDGVGVAGAYAQLDREHRLTLYSVWANPQGHGHGAALLRQVLADSEPHDLWLVADNRRAARFYQRHGFQPVRRELLGHRMLLARSDEHGRAA